jgi:hypothetical protein
VPRREQRCTLLRGAALASGWQLPAWQIGEPGEREQDVRYCTRGWAGASSWREACRNGEQDRSRSTLDRRRHHRHR